MLPFQNCIYVTICKEKEVRGLELKGIGEINERDWRKERKRGKDIIIF